MGEFAIGQPVPRFEDPRLVKGHGRYVADAPLPPRSPNFDHYSFVSFVFSVVREKAWLAGGRYRFGECPRQGVLRALPFGPVRSVT